MKYLIQRYSNTNKSNNVGFVRIGNDVFSLRKTKEHLRGILNSSEIFLTNVENKVNEKLACLLANVFSYLCKKNASNQLVLYRVQWRDKEKEYPSEELLEKITPRISSDIKVLLRSHPREECKKASQEIEKISENINSNALFHNMGVFSRRIHNASVSLESAHHYSEIISKKQLIASMWGAAKTQRYLNQFNEKIASIKNNINKAGMHNELIKRGSAKIQKCVKETSLNSDEKLTLNKVVIPGILESYSKFKKIATDTMLEISPLLYVDEVFQHNTKYPASWFISDEIIHNMKEDFDHLASFVGDLPIIESKVVIPLEMVGSRITE